MVLLASLSSERVPPTKTHTAFLSQAPPRPPMAMWKTGHSFVATRLYRVTHQKGKGPHKPQRLLAVCVDEISFQCGCGERPQAKLEESGEVAGLNKTCGPIPGGLILTHTQVNFTAPWIMLKEIPGCIYLGKHGYTVWFHASPWTQLIVR